MQESIMQQGFDLMLFGMGSVFIFLTLLVIATTAMSAVVQRFFPEALKPAAPAPSQVPAAGADARLQAVIKAAIDQHRKRQR